VGGGGKRAWLLNSEVGTKECLKMTGRINKAPKPKWGVVGGWRLLRQTAALLREATTQSEQVCEHR